MHRTYNVIDADGHILEPPDLWTKNIEPKFRDKAPRVIVDTDGKDRCLVAGMKIGHPRISFRLPFVDRYSHKEQWIFTNCIDPTTSETGCS